MLGVELRVVLGIELRARRRLVVADFELPGHDDEHGDAHHQCPHDPPENGVDRVPAATFGHRTHHPDRTGPHAEGQDKFQPIGGGTPPLGGETAKRLFSMGCMPRAKKA